MIFDFLTVSLKEIFCQEKALGILQRAYASAKMPHAYVFAGDEGVGKFKTAREWAKLLLCENPSKEQANRQPFADNCGLCRCCRFFDAGCHPDFHLVYKELREFTEDGKGKRTPVDVPIDVVREFLIEKVSFKPTVSKRKVFVLTEAEKLNTYSQNCLLKVLEEPPGYCCIILLCTGLDKLLPTIKSRCTVVNFAPVCEDMILEKLKNIDHLQEEKARYFAALAQGSVGWACKWAQLELADANLYQTKRELVAVLSKYQYPQALEAAGQLLSHSHRIAAVWTKLDKNTSITDINRNAAKILLRIIISVLRDVVNLNLGQRQKMINFDQKTQVKSLSRRLEPETASQKIIDVYRAMQLIDAAVNERLIFEQLLLNLASCDKIK